MTSDADAKRRHIHSTVLKFVSRSDARRQEAIREYLLVMRPDLTPAATDLLAAKTPPLLPALYDKWIGMFIERLFETLPEEQLALVCDGQEDTNAALVLAYIMFLESARMEKQIEDDLKSCDLDAADGMAAFVAQEMARIDQDTRNSMQEKAARYQAARAKG